MIPNWDIGLSQFNFLEVNKKMKKFTATIEKVQNVPGTKKLKNGHFVDLPYCPYCKTHVQSLMNCLKENHQNE